MPLKVLIVGSFQPEDAASDSEAPTSKRSRGAVREGLLERPDVAERKAAVEAACRAIGEELAQRGAQIIVGSENPIDADPWIVAGAAGVKAGRARIWVVQPARSGEDPDRDRRAEIVCGLLLAFGLALLFLVGAITIVGDPKGVFAQSGTDFERTAVVMTLLGLAGGLVIEQAADALRRRFGARLGDIAPNNR
jgi:hypothetical protein